MTGNELKAYMADLDLSFGDLAEATGYTRNRLWQLVRLGEEAMPLETESRVRQSLLDLCQAATGAATGVLARLAGTAKAGAV